MIHAEVKVRIVMRVTTHTAMQTRGHARENKKKRKKNNIS